MKEVYIIISYDCEEMEIEHICLSEKTARKRFEEVRQKLLNKEKRTYEMYKERDDIFGMGRTQYYINVYNKISFDNTHPFEGYKFVGCKPNWIKKELEE